MAGVLKKKCKMKFNDLETIQSLMQELYNEACRNIEDIQNNMNQLASSTQLNDEILDSKAKFAKAMNDFIANKDKAIGRKLEIAKLMVEVYKFDGDVKRGAENALNNGDINVNNWRKILEMESDNSDTKVQTYKIK